MTKDGSTICFVSFKTTGTSHMHVQVLVVHMGFVSSCGCCEDLQVLESGEIPEHDVVVTNPPYSEDHVERALRFCASNLADHGRPWLMLLPNYCYAKNYFYPALKTGSLNAQKPFYLAPRKRYYYWTPKVRTPTHVVDDTHVEL